MLSRRVTGEVFAGRWMLIAGLGSSYSAGRVQLVALAAVVHYLHSQPRAADAGAVASVLSRCLVTLSGPALRALSTAGRRMKSWSETCRVGGRRRRCWKMRRPVGSCLSAHTGSAAEVALDPADSRP